MNVQGRNPFGIKRIEPVVFTIGRGIGARPKVMKQPKFAYTFKINNASYSVIKKNDLEAAEYAAHKLAKRGKDHLGTIQLISITKIICSDKTNHKTTSHIKEK